MVLLLSFCNLAFEICDFLTLSSKPRHIIPILIPLSRGKTKPSKAKDEKRPQRRPGLISRLFTRRTERPLSTMETQDLERWKEPEPSNAFAFPSLLNLVVDPASRSERKPRLNQINEDNNTGVFVRAAVPSTAFSLGDMPIQKEVVETLPMTTEDEQQQQVQEEDFVPFTEVKEESQPDPQEELQSESQEVSQLTNGNSGVPPVPMRAIPSIPTPVATPSPQGVAVGTNSNVPGSPTSDAPLASPNSFEEFDALEDADSDFVLVGTRPEPMKPVTLGSPSSELIIIPFQPIQRCETPTPTDELSDLSEVILSPVLSKGRNSQRLSQASTTASERDRAVSVHSISDAGSRRSAQTLTHSSQHDVTPPDTPTNIYNHQPPLPPPRPTKSLNRRTTNRSNATIPSLPVPPPTAILRSTLRNTSIPMSMSPPPYQEKVTQPKLNASPKIRALIQTLEGSNTSEDYGNVFVGSTRSLPFTPSAGFASRRESVSSVMGSSRAEFGSMWESYSTRSNTPEPMDHTDEFGVLQNANRGKDRRGSEDNLGNQWELRHVEGLHRSNSLPTSRCAL
jgi:hypothetical protein